MEHSQARDRANQTIRTEKSLVKQPSEPLDSTLAAHVQGEADVLADRAQFSSSEAEREAPALPAPQSSPEQVSGQRSSAKSKPPSSLPAKRQKSATKRKQGASFRRLWEVNQQLFAAEVQQLEAEAERLNQLLAERAHRKRQAQTPAKAAEPPLASPIEPAKQDTTQPSHPPSSKARCQSLRMTSQHQTRYVAEEAETENLQAQAARIHQLLAELAAAIAEGGEVAKSPDQPSNDSFRPELTSSADLLRAHQHSYAPEASLAERPSPQLPASEVQCAEEAAQTAAALRSLTHREPLNDDRQPWSDSKSAERLRSATAPQPLIGPQLPGAPFRPSAKGRRRLSWRQLLRPPQAPLDKLSDAVLWVVVAAVVRVGVRFLLSAVPALLPIVVLVLLAPAALAVYLAVWVPNARLLSIYRLFLVMLGLVLGGKL